MGRNAEKHFPDPRDGSPKPREQTTRPSDAKIRVGDGPPNPKTPKWITVGDERVKIITGS